MGRVGDDVRDVAVGFVLVVVLAIGIVVVLAWRLFVDTRDSKDDVCALFADLDADLRSGDLEAGQVNSRARAIFEYVDSELIGDMHLSDAAIDYVGALLDGDPVRVQAATDALAEICGESPGL